MVSSCERFSQIARFCYELQDFVYFELSMILLNYTTFNILDVTAERLNLKFIIKRSSKSNNFNASCSSLFSCFLKTKTRIIERFGRFLSMKLNHSCLHTLFNSVSRVENGTRVRMIKPDILCYFSLVFFLRECFLGDSARIILRKWIRALEKFFWLFT